MHPAIAAFPSAEFYDGRLKTKFDDNKPVEFDWPDPSRPLAFLHVDGKERRFGSSYSNQEEVEAVKLVLGRVFSSPSLVLTKKEVCVLSLYSGQVKLLRLAGLGVEVATIDSYQGRENSLVIVTTVRASGRIGDMPGLVILFYVEIFSGYSDDQRRVNVLLTRAKAGLIIVGHQETLLTSSLWTSWLGQAPLASLKASQNSVNQRGQARKKRADEEPKKARGR